MTVTAETPDTSDAASIPETTSSRDAVGQAAPARPRREIDPLPPKNPFARLLRDVQFNLEHRDKMPPGVPWSDVGFHVRSLKQPLQEMMRLHDLHGGICSIPLVHQRQVLVTDPALSREILVTKADHFGWRGGNFGELAPLLGHGVLTSDGVAHDRVRELMNPGFHRRRIEENLSLIFQEASDAVDLWESGTATDISVWSRDVTMRIAMRALVGFDADQSKEAVEAAELFEKALHYFGTGAARFARGPRTPWDVMEKATARLHEIVKRQIEVTRARSAPGSDMLSILVETEFADGSRFSDTEICDQVMTLLFAGHDTTSSTVTFLFYELARNSLVQDDVRRQVTSTTGDATPLTLGFGELLGEMPMLTMSIDETLRLYPPVWVGARVVMRDVTLGGYHLPAGTYVNYIPWVTHRLPEYFENPEAFRPDRFTPENRAKIANGAYTPFGGGDRICLGQRFGYTVSHAIAATALSRYRLETTVDTKLDIHTVPTLTPRGGMTLRPVAADEA